jgi:hypothetical protein
MMFPVDLVLRRQKPLFLICFDAGVAKFWLIIILLTHLVRPSKTELSSKAVARSDQASMSKHSSPIETHSHRFSFSFHEFLYFSGLQTYMYDNHRPSKKAATPSSKEEKNKSLLCRHNNTRTPSALPVWIICRSYIIIRNSGFLFFKNLNGWFPDKSYTQKNKIKIIL